MGIHTHNLVNIGVLIAIVQAQQQVFYGRFISTPTPDEVVIQNGAVLVSSDDGIGTIVASTWDADSLENAIQQLGAPNETVVVQSGEDGFFFPGFIGKTLPLSRALARKGFSEANFAIDTHIHAPQYPNSGLFQGTLLNWLQKYSYPMEASLGNPNSPAWANTTSPDPFGRARRVYTQVIKRTLSHGTTMASYFATNDLRATNLLANLAFSIGQRALVGRVCMDNTETTPDYYRDASSEAALNDTLASISYIQSIDPSGQMVAPIVTPRFAAGVTPESLTNMGNVANEQNIRIQTHLAENVAEVALVRRQFPNISSYTAVYDHYHLLTNRTILAHAVHIDDDEMELIKSRGSGISHCPVSNSALGSGFCHVRKILSYGIPVGLGTDVAGGFSPSILDQVRQAYLVSRSLEFLDNANASLDVNVAEGLYLGTMGGAKLAGMEGKMGGFDVGMYFDAQQIDLNTVDTVGKLPLEGVDIFGWETWQERVLKWVWLGTDINIKKVWVGGRLVHERL